MGKSAFLKSACGLRGIVRYLRKFGPRGIYFGPYSLISTRKKLVRVASHWSRDPLYVRLNSSDVWVFRQVFVENEYGVVDRIKQQLASIVDAAANIRLTRVLFAERYPYPEIPAIEPEFHNYERLCRNTLAYSKMRRFRAAVWGRDESVRIVKNDAEDWALRVSSLDDQLKSRVPGLSPLDLS
jgi:hypothetical protein